MRGFERAQRTNQPISDSVEAKRKRVVADMQQWRRGNGKSPYPSTIIANCFLGFTPATAGRAQPAVSRLKRQVAALEERLAEAEGQRDEYHGKLEELESLLADLVPDEEEASDDEWGGMEGEDYRWNDADELAGGPRPEDYTSSSGSSEVSDGGEAQ